MLLKSGADPNLAMSDGRTALHVAADNGGVSIIKYLLANGADVMKADNQGETVLHKAAKGCHHPTLKVCCLTDRALSHFWYRKQDGNISSSSVGRCVESQRYLSGMS